MLNWILDIGDTVLSLSNHDLSQIGYLILHCIFDLVKLIPKLLFDFLHVAPSIHSISFNISDFALVLLLYLLLAVHVTLQVGLFRWLDDYLCHLLGGLHLVNFQVLLEPLLDNF